LARAGRTEEALEQLQIVYEAMLAEERGAEAAATLERIRALDPNFAPRAAMSRQQAKREGLVFLDLDYGRRAADEDTIVPEAEPFARPLTAAGFGEVDLPAPADVSVSSTLDESPLQGLTPLEDPLTSMISDEARGPGPTMDQFESTSFAVDDSGADITPLAIEHNSLDEEAQQPDKFSEQSATLEEHTRALEELNADSASEDVGTDFMADALTGYVASLSTDVASIEGGLPDDLGILPIEAVAEEQAESSKSVRSDDEFVDLNEWLLEGEPAKNPRMKAQEEDQSTSDVQTDFSEMLETFKAGVAANVDESDSDSHYDLGVAYMEMGLFDEAISQFQKAMRGDATPERRVRAYESLGQSFIEKNEYQVAISSLGGALKESGLSDTKLVGVLYLLGYASERLSQWKEAEGYYRRVFAVDIHFRDIGERLKRAEQMA
jgi:tetratricopeptide (TPR) repeat protein